ncbi:MAG: SusD/RagB family nutrient-binding outer membrane lipoprotein, partial [Bacteroidales bacterium]|nr:SusD/RagB family nutrient-binding outer membrane lipoprotein [Bacteroidales bacterium]
MKIKANIYIIIFALLLGFTACVKDLTDINENPNEPLTTDLNYLFRYAQKEGISSYNSNVNLEQWSLMNWMMYLASRGGVEAGKEYTMPSGKDAFWTEQYATALINTNQIIILTKDDSEKQNMYAAALIWKNFLFHRITDLWGDIPYSEALKAASNLDYAPKYDSQEDIYYSMLEELKLAESLLKNDKEFFDPSADIIGNANIDTWKRFANSLRLRLATRIKNKNHARYVEELNDLASKLLISSNSESILFAYNSINRNPFYEGLDRQETTNQNNPSKYFIDLLTNLNDPRISIFAKKAPLSVLPWIPDYNGVPNLMPSNHPNWADYNLDGTWGDISRIGEWFRRNETPGIIISYSEVCFLLAEAVLDGAWAGSAQQLYEDGIKASLNFYEMFGGADYKIDATEQNNYLQSVPAVDLEQIILQKWITFAFSNGYEAYAEYRRTGFPILKTFGNNNIDASRFPKRIPYPNFEINLNFDNYNQVVQQQG